jgi:hypothetical protein
MSEMPQPRRPNEDAAPATSRKPASTQADLQKRRQIVYEYAAALREFVAATATEAAALKGGRTLRSRNIRAMG